MQFIISCSADPRCQDHKMGEDNFDCNECKVLREHLKGQIHKCTFTCHSKKGTMKIRATEGLGINCKDPAEEFIVKPCRFGFKRFPLDKTEILYPPEKDDKNINEMKKDNLHIRKYLERTCRDEVLLKKLEQMNFWEFLYDLGMYDKKASSWEDEKYQDSARKRYLNAISVNIKGTASIFMKRSTSEISINNYSPQLLPILKSNHDIQLVMEKYGCANL